MAWLKCSQPVIECRSIVVACILHSSGSCVAIRQGKHDPLSQRMGLEQSHCCSPVATGPHTKALNGQHEFHNDLSSASSTAVTSTLVKHPVSVDVNQSQLSPRTKLARQRTKLVHECSSDDLAERRALAESRATTAKPRPARQRTTDPVEAAALPTAASRDQRGRDLRSFEEICMFENRSCGGSGGAGAQMFSQPESFFDKTPRDCGAVFGVKGLLGIFVSYR